MTLRVKKYPIWNIPFINLTAVRKLDKITLHVYQIPSSHPCQLQLMIADITALKDLPLRCSIIISNIFKHLQRHLTYTACNAKLGECKKNTCYLFFNGKFWHFPKSQPKNKIFTLYQFFEFTYAQRCVQTKIN